MYYMKYIVFIAILFSGCASMTYDKCKNNCTELNRNLAYWYDNDDTKVCVCLPKEN